MSHSERTSDSYWSYSNCCNWYCSLSKASCFGKSPFRENIQRLWIWGL